MLKLLRVLCFALVCAAVAVAEWTSPHNLKLEKEAPASLIPFPRKVEWKEDELKLPAASGWKLTGSAAKDASIQLAWKGLLSELKTKGKGKLTVRLRSAGNKLNDEQKAEGYIMQVNAKGITIAAETTAGFFYGLQTLRQLVYNNKSIPHCNIKDWPAFQIRGYLQDCGRNFRKLDRLKKEIDLAARLKVNMFHWHMTDKPGWRVQCKKYPELTKAETRTRDLNDTYSYAEIRELFDYARKRHIQIIPELDMPGHSDYFRKAFGCDMASDKGMDICVELIDEFCKELPKDVCPYINFGADEIHINNAKQFVDRICEAIQANDREHIQWFSSRDLKPHEKSIRMRWSESVPGCYYSLKNIEGRTLDYAIGYCNVYPPALMIRRYFFMRPCGVAKGDEQSLGVVLGIWPDGKVDNKEWIPGMCNMWPSMCAMAERAWIGGEGDGDLYAMEMPAPDTEAAKAYHSFEQRLAGIRKSIFEDEDFPAWTESTIQWKLVEPISTSQADATRTAVLQGKLDGLTTRDAHCANLFFRTRAGSGNMGMLRDSRPGCTVWAVTKIKVSKAGKYPFMIGFDAPERSNRRWTGVPQNGQWSQAGTRIWVNGREIHNPRSYKLAGQRTCKRPFWNFDQPLDLEEIWWMLGKTDIALKKGDNTIVIEQPYVGEHQDWSISFMPLFKHK